MNQQKREIDRRHSDDELWSYVDNVDIDLEHLAQKQGIADQQLANLRDRCEYCRSEQEMARLIVILWCAASIVLSLVVIAVALAT